MVTRLDRLARSLADACDIAEELTEAGIKLNIGGTAAHTSAELAELSGVARSAVYRAVQRAGEPTAARTSRT